MMQLLHLPCLMKHTHYKNIIEYEYTNIKDLTRTIKMDMVQSFYAAFIVIMSM